jgi:glycosyltransferase involved in cell wall biosynthesis
MRSSLVLTTYNWPDALRLVLISALEQSVLPDEILVADDGSAEPTAEVVRAFTTRFAERGVPLHHVWHPDQGFRAATIRNRALARATGDYVLLIDGDCVLHRDFVRSHLAFARTGQFVQGTRVLLHAERSARALAGGETRFGALERGIGNRMNALSMGWLSPLVPTPTDPLKGVRSCNMGFWLADARRVNGFNERFVGWGREDSEFVVRLVNAGVRRRKLKFGGIMYHLWHPERERDALGANDELLDSVRRAGSVWAEDGMDKYGRTG